MMDFDANTGTFDDGNPLNYQEGGMGQLGPGPLGPVALFAEKRNWNPIYQVLRSGRLPDPPKPAGTAGLGEDKVQRLIEQNRALVASNARRGQIIAELRRRVGS